MQSCGLRSKEHFYFGIETICTLYNLERFQLRAQQDGTAPRGYTGHGSGWPVSNERSERSLSPLAQRATDFIDLSFQITDHLGASVFGEGGMVLLLNILELVVQALCFQHIAAKVALASGSQTVRSGSLGAAENSQGKPHEKPIT